MVPKIHKKGRSFRAAAGYLLHDIDAETNDRVAWTATRNLATRNPDLAWRVMAATAMDQDRLKAEAGIAKTGRKSKDHVLHFTLSWHPEEAPKLDKTEMMRAANTVLHVMGAGRHQCLIVAHNDQPQPHVHVVVNRVDPSDGRILSSSFEKLKASRWAQAYEEARGKIYCHERVLNNAARDRDEFTRGDKDTPRQVYETMQAAQDAEWRQAILAEHKQRARLLKETERRQAARHQAAWAQHEAAVQMRQRSIAQAAQKTLAKRLHEVRSAYRPRWTMLHHQQLAAERQFMAREEKLLGKVHNALKSIDFRSLVSRKYPDAEGRWGRLSHAFQLLSDRGAREEALRREHQHAAELLKQEQLLQEKTLREKVAAAQAAMLARSRHRADQERSALILDRAMERAKLRAQWLQKREALQQELRELKRETPQPAQEPPRPTPAKRTQPSDLLPPQGRDQAAKVIDGWQVLRDDPYGPQRPKDRDGGRER